MRIKNVFKSSLRWMLFQLRFGLKIKLMRNIGKKIIFLVNSAVHGNMGDQALGYARLKFIKNLNLHESLIVEFTTRDEMRFWKYIVDTIKNDDVIIIRGGGYWGDLWIDGFNWILLYIDTFKKNRIIVFPQSVFFSNTYEGNRLLKKSERIINNSLRLKIFARDLESFNSLRNIYPNTDVFLTPDTVLSITPNIHLTRKNGVLLCLRSDKEKSMDYDDKIIHYLDEREEKYFFQDTNIDYSLKKLRDREKCLFNIWTKFASSRFVITDRLHGMIFSVITETPCIVFDNIDHKIENQYNWLKNLPYVYFARDYQDFIDYYEEIIANNNYSFDNVNLNENFEILRKEILKTVYGDLNG